MAKVKQLIDWDVFFYYGQDSKNLELELQSDLICGLTQSKRTLFYNREYGAGVYEKENYPIGFTLVIGMRFDIAMHIARENQKVSNGLDGTVDRRISVSQNSVEVGQPQDDIDNGSIDVKVTYVPFATKVPQLLNLPIGV